MSIKEINLETGKVSEREWREDEVEKHNIGFEKDKENNKINAVLAELNDIDSKSIRALREGDTVRLADLEAEAKELRKKLK